jgi:hypothetical protein
LAVKESAVWDLGPAALVVRDGLLVRITERLFGIFNMMEMEGALSLIKTSRAL